MICSFTPITWLHKEQGRLLYFLQRQGNALGSNRGCGLTWCNPSCRGVCYLWCRMSKQRPLGRHHSIDSVDTACDNNRYEMNDLGCEENNVRRSGDCNSSMCKWLHSADWDRSVVRSGPSCSGIRVSVASSQRNCLEWIECMPRG